MEEGKRDRERKYMRNKIILEEKERKKATGRERQTRRGEREGRKVSL